jgi:PPM family protein phosphatase
MAQLEQQSPSRTASSRKPLDSEIDAYGLTHRGTVRPNNQDNFLICTLHKNVQVLGTSLPDIAGEFAGTDRVGALAVVADGVGGGQHGEQASAFAVHGVTDYVLRSMRCYYASDASIDTAFGETLESAAVQAHVALLQRAQRDPDLRGMATTLTLWLGAWPKAYLLQVGDSRFYLMRDGKLTQISRDQTLAEELVKDGALTRTEAHRTPWVNVLSSAIGGPQHMPVVTTLDQRWGDVGMLCSDGLTKHVSDDRIRERLGAMTSARDACERLVQDALDGGGSDNITVVVGRAVARKG